MFVQHNLLAENANRQLKVSTGKNAKLTEKLSSGYKINRAADDAAGLSISEKMRRQVRGLHQTVSNISEGVGYVQTAEGALNEVHDMLQRINELAVKAANGTNTVEDRAAIDAEIRHLKNEMNRIFSTTTYNEKKIWEPGDRKLLGYDKRQAVNFTGSSYQYIQESVTNANCGVIANSTSDYIIRADAVEGVWVEWKGWDDEDYTTEKVSWKDLKDNN
ncbi:MAG: flagellin, partial [Lachnospiraceae bacterium]|nr:flagellin [Lachnospiraceae bacterium]